MLINTVPDPNAPARPWGLLATLGLGLVIWYTLELLQAAMGFGIDRVLTDLRLVDPAQDTQALGFALITCVTTVLCSALIFAAAGLQDGVHPRSYLGLGPVKGRVVLHWLVVTAVIVAQTELVLYLVKGELIPAEWGEVYRSVRSPLLFWFALMVATPIFEELLFRGFVFEGIRAWRLGSTGAVLITALAWTSIHNEFEPLEFGIIFIIGVLLGIARLRTGSVLVTIAMHMLYSLISIGEMAWLSLEGDS